MDSLNDNKWIRRLYFGFKVSYILSKIFTDHTPYNT